MTSDGRAAAQGVGGSAARVAGPRLCELFLPTFSKLASVQPGERVLDLCAAEGGAILESAARSGPEGEQLALDRDQGRLTALRARAAAAGLRALAVEHPDDAAAARHESYWDVVQCHLAFDRLDDPEAAVREAGRILRPVGRLALTIWGQRARCPLLTIVLDALAPFTPRAKALDRALFRYGETGALAQLLVAAGFEDAVPDRLTEWPAFADVDEYWATVTGDHRFAPLIADLDAAQLAEARAAVESKTRFYRRRTGLEIKVEGLVLAAVK